MKPTSFKWLINSFAISVSLVSVEAVPSVFAQTCYTDNRGNIVDLGGLCRTTEDRTAPAPQTQTQPIQGGSLNELVYDAARTPFPAWLFDDDLYNENAYKTGQMSYGESTLFIYQNRFIKDFTQWPHTTSATNHAEWVYLDCRTGWLGYKDSPMVGTSDPFFSPPARMRMHDGAVETYRGLCNRAGLQHGF